MLLPDTDLAQRVEQAAAALHDCHLCGNDCGIDRAQGPGPCTIAGVIHVVQYGPHPGEESPISGSRGSGTIFFSGCNLHCIYCQNYDISQSPMGAAVKPAELAGLMLSLQAQGCHNINLVSPTHVAAHMVPALVSARQAGLRVPIVYNTGGYDAPQALALMDGLVDIYMPDMKYADPEIGWRLSGVRDYPAVNKAAVREMYRQVGDLVLDAEGIATRGLLVRHLVLPDDLAGTAEIARFLVEEISAETYINVMAQYYPAYCATEHPALRRRVTPAEVAAAEREARAVGLHRFG
ncbi:MAG: radical SAM protein [Anaerolineae bacterium]|jgi:putative pyruvate formate lyase activating enzyme|nr:radical SAM protein [Anaerolineae bacterium]